MAQPASTRSSLRLRSLAARGFHSEYLVLLLCAVYVLALGAFTPGFLTLGNAVNVLITLLPLFIVSTGQTVVLVGGGIDLSVGSIIALCSIAGAAVMSGDHGLLAGNAAAVPVGISAMLAAGALVGSLNGLAVTRLRMPPFIVTLTTMMFFSGLAVWLTRSKNIGNLPAGFNAIGGKLWLSLPVTVVVGCAAHLMLSRSLWGHWLFATGRNQRAALISGVPINGVVISGYVVSGLLAALSSVLYTGQAETGSPVLGQRLLLDVVGAAVLGGTSLFGGKGKVLWTLFGVLFIKLLDNSLNLLDLSYFSIMMVKGGVILFASLSDAFRNRAAA
jgi:ribose/xylose/arabinose/galactoside ABC-type transport system permease subunit